MKDYGIELIDMKEDVTFRIVCDKCGIYMSGAIIVDNRFNIESIGWTVDGDKHLCPSCGDPKFRLSILDMKSGNEIYSIEGSSATNVTRIASEEVRKL